MSSSWRTFWIPATPCKPARREQEIYADYVGYTIPDAFVVGYGLDYAEEYRNLPYIGVLSPSVYSHE